MASTQKQKPEDENEEELKEITTTPKTDEHDQSSTSTSPKTKTTTGNKLKLIVAQSSSFLRVVFTLGLMMLTYFVVFSNSTNANTKVEASNSISLSKDSINDYYRQKENPATTTTNSKSSSSSSSSQNQNHQYRYVYYDGEELIKEPEKDGIVEKQDEDIADNNIPVFEFIVNSNTNDSYYSSQQQQQQQAKWIVIDRKLATNLFQSKFGSQWMCGINRDLNLRYEQDDDDIFNNNDDDKKKMVKNPALISELHSEFNKLGIRQNFESLSKTFATLHELWKKEKQRNHHNSKNKSSATSKTKVLTIKTPSWNSNSILPFGLSSSPYQRKEKQDSSHQDENSNNNNNNNKFISNSNSQRQEFYDLLYKTCSPRVTTGGSYYFASNDPEKNKVELSSSSSSIIRKSSSRFLNTFKLRSVSKPSLGKGCLRKFMVLDGNAPSLNDAMTKRCFFSSSSNNNNKRRINNDNNNNPFVVGLGHSHTRYLLAMVCMIANNSWCHEFSGIKSGRVPFYPSSLFDSLYLKPDDIVLNDNNNENDVSNNLIGDEDENKNSNNNNNNQQQQQQSSASSTSTKGGTPSLTKPETTFDNPQIREQPLKLVYSASYYDQRISFLKLLTWMNGQLISSEQEFKKDKKLMRLLTKQEEKDKTDWTAGLGTLSMTTMDADDGDNNRKRQEKLDAENDQFDQQIIDWVLEKKKEKGNHFPSPTHFLLSRGEWDMLYLNPNPLAMMMQIERAMNVISGSFPESTLIFQLPQRHYPVPLHRRAVASHEKKANRNAIWRNTCSSDERIQLVRDACICAAARSLGARKGGKNKAIATTGKLILFDTDELTMSEFGKVFVDTTGHHYIDEALEVMAQEIRRIIERKSVAEEFSSRTIKYLEEVSDASCKKVEAAGKKFAEKKNKNYDELKKCSCHRDMPEDPGFCKSVRMLPRSVG